MMNPIFESSARRRMRTVRTPLIFVAYLLLLVLLMATQFEAFYGQGVTVNAMRVGIESYIWMTALQFFLIILVAPALSAISISGERERQTFDLLLVTGVGVRKIIVGKLMESFSFFVLMILCSTPMMVTVLVLGGVTVIDVLITQIYLLAIAWAALCTGMVASVLFKHSILSIVTAYLFVFAIGAGTWGLAKHGPLAAAYTYEQLNVIAEQTWSQALIQVPPTVFLNPAIGLVMLLAGQTGILHRTMEETMRLYQIHTVCNVTGFTPVAYVTLAAILIAAFGLLLLAMGILHYQTGGIRRRAKKH